MRLLVLLFLTSLLTSCNSESDPFGKMNDFDQGPMLENFADNLILPAYRSLAESTTAVSAAISAFDTEQSLENLQAARTALKDARMSWQYCSPYQFGPAESNGLAGVLNIYPVDTFKINRNVEDGEYDLSTLANADARGFQAIGYLLNRPGKTDQEILVLLSDDHISYLKAVAAQIAKASEEVYAAWKVEEGNYVATFTSADSYGVNVGSSVGKLVNAMNLDFERNTRDGKIGIPVGIRSLGEPILHASEAFYAGYSSELFRASIVAYHQLYLGADGEGLDDYLKAIEATTTQNADLSEQIDAQFKAIIAAGDNLTDPLPAQIETDIATVQAVFAEMQRLAVLLKTDMASSLGVVITYQDNDGD